MTNTYPIPDSNDRPPLLPSPRAPGVLPVYSPTSLNQHANCPEAFLHERVLKTPPARDEDSLALIKGTVAHALLERYVGLDPAARVPFPASLADEAARSLAWQGLSAADARHGEAVANVVVAVTNGIAIVETELAEATVLVGEQFLDLRWERGPSPFRLMAKIDVLAVYPGGIIETIDWKTGATRDPNQLQNVICRLVTEANAARMLGSYLPGGCPTEIRTSVCQLGTRDVTTVVFDRADPIAEFAAIRDRIVRIEQAKTNPTPGSLVWRPQPGWLCNFCPFVAACSYHAAPADGATLAWLDPVANPPA